MIKENQKKISINLANNKIMAAINKRLIINKRLKINKNRLIKANNIK